MKKPPLQDVIVKSRDSHNTSQHGTRPQTAGVRPPAHKHKPEQVAQEGVDTHEQTTFQNEPEIDTMPPKRSRRRRATLRNPRKRRWFIVALGVGGVVVLSSIVLSLLFAGATVVVYPKQDTVLVNNTFVVEENTTVEDRMTIQKMTIEETAQREVVALGEQEVEERASGKVTLYNEYSESPQRIIPRTRFESSDGLVYRVARAVEIPGKKPDGTPGEVEITIQAEESGEAHNIGPDTFTLPGYTEAGLLTHAEKIYARSSSDMSGGFKGVRRTVDDAERAQVVEALKTELRDTLLANAFGSIDNPETQHLFKDAVFFEFETLEDTLSGTDKVTIRVKGILHGILFPKDALATRLAAKALPTYNDSPIRIDNMKNLSVTLTPEATEEDTSIKGWEAPVYNATVEGKAHFIWEFEEVTLKEDLAGKEKSILDIPQDNMVLTRYPGIDRLEVSVRPFWKRTFPESTSDIHVITKLDE